MALDRDDVGELVTAAACRALYDHYASSPNVRVAVLQVAHLALTLAVDDGSKIDEPHIHAAIVETGR